MPYAFAVPHANVNCDSIFPSVVVASLPVTERAPPSSTGEQGFHTCVNLREHSFQPPKLHQVLFSIFLFPSFPPPQLWCFPLLFISFKICYHDQMKKIVCSLKLLENRIYQLLEIYIVKKLILQTERSIWPCLRLWPLQGSILKSL